jgi:hypothetical protein
VTAVWDERLLPRARAQQMTMDWLVYEEVHLRCAMPAFSADEAQLGRDRCGQSMGIVTAETGEDERLAMTVRHMVMAHDRALPRGTGD